MDESKYVPPDTWRHQMMLKRQGHKQIARSLTANINSISVGYMKNTICLVNEKSLIPVEKVL